MHSKQYLIQNSKIWDITIRYTAPRTPHTSSNIVASSLLRLCLKKIELGSCLFLETNNEWHEDQNPRRWIYFLRKFKSYSKRA